MADSARYILYKARTEYFLSKRQQRGATQLEQYRYHYIQDSHILQIPDEGQQGPQQFL